MNEVLLCTHNPILIRNSYGILRDEGFNVEIADHPALAVQMVFAGKYIAVIIDSESFGLSAEETVRIIRSISPDMPIIVAGNDTYTGGVLSVKTPVDLEEFKEVIHTLIGSVKFLRTKEEQECL
jgi:DNA-binding NtrC family response regulator